MRRSGFIPGWALYVIGAMTLFRLIVASQIPLNEDEAYYWSWSLHLSYGYTDHPPMVGWLAAVGSVLGHNSLAVRAPFIACEAIAALAVGCAATLVAGDVRAGGAAAMMLTFVPQPRWIIGQALPDAPYVCFWALSLWLVYRLVVRPRSSDAVLLGLAMSGAMLSRFFGLALVLGVAAFALMPSRRFLWKNGLWASFLIVIALYAPFVVWNAEHNWENYAFTLYTRQPFYAFSAARLEVLSTLRFLAFALPNVAVTTYLVVRGHDALLAWTGLPLVIVMIALSFFKTMESYWLLGPLASQIVVLGAAYLQWRPAWRSAARIFGAAVAAFAVATVTAMALPERAQAALLRSSLGVGKGLFYSGAYAYAPLAARLRELEARRHAVVITDRMEIAGELLFNGVDGVAIGPGPQIPQWQRWYDPAATAPSPALLVTFAPPDQNSDTVQRIAGAYARVTRGPTLRFDFAGTVAREFVTMYCEGPSRDAAAILFPNRR